MDFLWGKQLNRPMFPQERCSTNNSCDSHPLAGKALKMESTNLRLTGCLHVGHVPNCCGVIIWISKKPIVILNELYYRGMRKMINLLQFGYTVHHHSENLNFDIFRVSHLNGKIKCFNIMI